MSKQKSSSHPMKSVRRKKSTAATAGSTAKSIQPAPSASSVADGAQQRMIAEGAYYRSQERGFVAGRELDDWLAAEAEVSGYFLEQEPTAAELH